MKNLLLAATVAASLTLAGCATAPSKPVTFDQLGQFSSIPLNAQTFRISFKTNANMNYGTAEEITLVKAAQTTLQKGFQFFKVLDDPSNRTQLPPRQAVVYPSPMPYPYGYYRRHPAFWPDPFYDMPQVVTLDPVQVAYTVECFKTEKTAPKDAFDARLILQALGPKYGLSSTGEVLPAPVPAASK